MLDVDLGEQRRLVDDGAPAIPLHQDQCAVHASAASLGRCDHVHPAGPKFGRGPIAVLIDAYRRQDRSRYQIGRASCRETDTG